MRKLLQIPIVFALLLPKSLLAQTNEWSTQYVTFDDAVNGTGQRTASVAALGADSFVALVTTTAEAPSSLESLFFEEVRLNYLVGYVDADSASGRVAPQEYSPASQIEVWSSGLDQVSFNHAWQIAGGKNNYVYVANNDDNHNILVFELTPLGVVSTDFRMETGGNNIFAIDVDTVGNVYVVDFEGDDTKTDEVKVFAPIGAEGTTWGDVGGHNDPPTATIDLPSGIYLGLTANGDGSQVFVSQSSERKILKYVGSPTSGYTLDNTFDFTLDPSDFGTNDEGTFNPSVLGLSYLNEPGVVFAAADSIFFPGTAAGAYSYGRVYVIDGASGANVDTIDVAQWNFDRNESFSTTSRTGTEGSFTSVMDTDVTAEGAVYTQTYFGWAVEKWIFDGDIDIIVSVEQIAETIPESFDLRQNYPNPFNPSTTIEFNLQKSGHVTLSVYNVLGERVATLIDERFAPGSYKTTFDASGFPNGVYYYSLETGSFKATKKMVLTK